VDEFVELSEDAVIELSGRSGLGLWNCSLADGSHRSEECKDDDERHNADNPADCQIHVPLPRIALG
jgi:hypothetical protein